MWEVAGPSGVALRCTGRLVGTPTITLDIRADHSFLLGNAGMCTSL